ncbi:MAG: molybdopterin molybdotransferase MoeA, partial [Candidatus Binatia bacterium]
MKPFLSLKTTEEALAELAARTVALGAETVGTREALGRVLAEDVTAREDVPHFFRSNMDGFAVRARDTFSAGEESSVSLRLAGEVAMGEAAHEELAAGEAIRVSTGAMMPPGADAVVIVENTEESGASVLVRRAVVPSQNTIAIAEDLRAGATVLEAGHRLRGSDVGAVTGVGRAEVLVHRIPRVGVAATGDEIVEPEDELPPGKVRNVNQYLLGNMARALGARVVDYGVVRDREEDLDELFRRARAECDVLLLSGGSSKGNKDLVLSSILRVPGAEVHFHGIAIAPGKPTMFADAGDLPVLGVPGNPSAAAVVFVLFG